jgi:hypothetical protein
MTSDEAIESIKIIILARKWHYKIFECVRKSLAEQEL